jgi:predicted TIM-barrel fold metal-dependent hydrolase
VIAEYMLPAIFQSGHSSSGMRCGGGLQLSSSNPMLLEDVATAFPDNQIIVAPELTMAGRSAVAGDTQAQHLDRPVGGSPQYFPTQLVQYANTLLRDRILFGSD